MIMKLLSESSLTWTHFTQKECFSLLSLELSPVGCTCMFIDMSFLRAKVSSLRNKMPSATIMLQVSGLCHSWPTRPGGQEAPKQPLNQDCGANLTTIQILLQGYLFSSVKMDKLNVLNSSFCSASIVKDLCLKPKIIDTDNSMVIARGKGSGGSSERQRGLNVGDRRWLDFGW